MISIPNIIEKRIVNLSNENNVSADTLRTEYREIFSDEFVQHDEQFKTDLKTRFFHQDPHRPHTHIGRGRDNLMASVAPMCGARARSLDTSLQTPSNANTSFSRQIFAKSAQPEA